MDFLVEKNKCLIFFWLKICQNIVLKQSWDDFLGMMTKFSIFLEISKNIRSHFGSKYFSPLMHILITMV